MLCFTVNPPLFFFLHRPIYSLSSLPSLSFSISLSLTLPPPPPSLSILHGDGFYLMFITVRQVHLSQTPNPGCDQRCALHRDLDVLVKSDTRLFCMCRVSQLIKWKHGRKAEYFFFLADHSSQINPQCFWSCSLHEGCNFVILMLLVRFRFKSACQPAGCLVNLW